MTYKTKRQPGRAGASSGAQSTENTGNHTPVSAARQFAATAFHESEERLNREVAREWGKVSCKYGLDPATREQAAAHEAGHIVVACALGDIIRRASIYTEQHFGRTAWVGRNWRKNKSLSALPPVAIDENPSLALRAAAILQAGFVGELIMQLHHPSSSFDERYRAGAIAGRIDQVMGYPSGTANLMIGTICVEVIDQNRVQFEAIRAHLCIEKSLEADQAAVLLANCKPYDLTEVEEKLASFTFLAKSFGAVIQ